MGGTSGEKIHDHKGTGAGMNITLHIERLVLDGLPLTHGQSTAVKTALEGELARLLKERGMQGVTGGAVPHLSVASIHLSPGAHPTQWARQIAHTLYAGLTPVRAVPANPTIRS